jgi:hypothetical protein
MYVLEMSFLIRMPPEFVERRTASVLHYCELVLERLEALL